MLLQQQLLKRRRRQSFFLQAPRARALRDAYTMRFMVLHHAFHGYVYFNIIMLGSPNKLKKPWKGKFSKGSLDASRVFFLAALHQVTQVALPRQKVCVQLCCAACAVCVWLRCKLDVMSLYLLAAWHLLGAMHCAQCAFTPPRVGWNRMQGWGAVGLDPRSDGS